MSKKTNNTTLREIKSEKNLFYKDFHNYLHFYKFVKNIENLMYIKNIVLNVNNLNTNLNSLHFNSNIYLNTRKIYFYKKVSKKLFFQNKNSKSNLIFWSIVSNKLLLLFYLEYIRIIIRHIFVVRT